MATQNEIDAGAAALKSFVNQLLESQGKGWEEMFIPDEAYPTASQDVLEAADGAKSQSIDSRQAAGLAALRNALNASGEGTQVTDVQCSVATVAILSAVAVMRKIKP